MTDEQIKQNAEQYAEEHAVRIDGGGWEEEYDYEEQENAFIAGAHSRDEEIEHLRKALSSAQKAMAELAKMARNPWISVEERLPEKTKALFSCQVKDEEEDKLVFYKDTRGYIHTGYFNAKGHWRDYDRDNGAIYKVTHWMPIPQTKKGE